MKYNNNNNRFMALKQLNLALVFLCLFCVVVHFFWLVNVCFCFVRFSFFISSQEIGLWTSLKWPILCRVQCKTLTQSINQCYHSHKLVDGSRNDDGIEWFSTVDVRALSHLSFARHEGHLAYRLPPPSVLCCFFQCCCLQCFDTVDWASGRASGL